MKPRIGEVLLALLAMGAAFALDASFASVGGIFAKPQLALACQDGRRAMKWLRGTWSTRVPNPRCALVFR
jgi:hypothetical protein